MLTPVSSFLEELRALKPAGKLGAAFGSHGWKGGAVESIEQYLSEAGLLVQPDSQKSQWSPDQETLTRCRNWGEQFAQLIRGGV